MEAVIGFSYIAVSFLLFSSLFTALLHFNAKEGY